MPLLFLSSIYILPTQIPCPLPNLISPYIEKNFTFSQATSWTILTASCWRFLLVWSSKSQSHSIKRHIHFVSSQWFSIPSSKYLIKQCLCAFWSESWKIVTSVFPMPSPEANRQYTLSFWDWNMAESLSWKLLYLPSNPSNWSKCKDIFYKYTCIHTSPILTEPGLQECAWSKCAWSMLDL